MLTGFNEGPPSNDITKRYHFYITGDIIHARNKK